jgi:hypothetical protein
MTGSDLSGMDAAFRRHTMEPMAAENDESGTVSLPEAAGSVSESTSRATLAGRRRLPCGAKVCLRCHGDCGPQRTSYILEGLDETEPGR